jgi:hypothetical protein
MPFNNVNKLKLWKTLCRTSKSKLDKLKVIHLKKIFNNILIKLINKKWMKFVNKISLKYFKMIESDS